MSLARDLELVKRGATINVLGAAGRLALLAAPLLGVRLFGDRYGALALCLAFVGMAGFFCSAGFSDATQFLCAHDADVDRDEPGRKRMAAVVVAALVASVGISVALSLALLIRGESIGALAFGRPSLGPLLGVAGMALPFVAITAIATAALRSSMEMGSDVAVKSFVVPFVFVGSTLVAHRFTADPVGMAWAFTVAQGVGAAVAIGIVSHKLGVSLTLAALRMAPWRRLMTFAVPQSVNMALYQSTFDLDIMMLGASGTPDRLLGAYRVASEISRQIFTIRVTFSGVYASLVARLAHLGKTHALSDSIGIVSGWCVLVAAPIGAVLIISRTALFTMAGYPEVPSAFFCVLVLGSMASCAFGLTGNVIGMAGRPGLNLMNAIGATAVNAGCNLVLVPRLGLLGAAIGTTAGICVTQIAQVFETRFWFGVQIPCWPVLRPFAYCTAAFISAVVLQATAPWNAAWLSPLVFVLGYAVLYVAIERRMHS